MSERIMKIVGTPGSPYTRKLIAYARFRHLRHQVLWRHPTKWEDSLPISSVRLLPTIYFEDGAGSLESMIDTTPIIERLENESNHRSTKPSDQILGFLNDLIEDYADEWLPKAMFHYRWTYAADTQKAGALLSLWHEPSLAEDEALELQKSFAARQIGRLEIVGSTVETREVIESSYVRLLDVLRNLILDSSFLFGDRPATADFAIFGQLSQLILTDPTPAQIADNLSWRLRAWTERLEDLSGVSLNDGQWFERNIVIANIQPLLNEIGQTYVPVMLANFEAIANGETEFELKIGQATWRQKTSNYQEKCISLLRDRFDNLSANDRLYIRDVLDLAKAGSLVVPS